jgi:glucose-1-phosphate adenylyltransferase
MAIPEGKSVNTLAMILAGGVGSRLSVLSGKRAKPAVPFGGIYRIIDFTLSNVMRSEIPVVGICTQYKPYSLMDHISIGEPWGFDRRGYEAKILPPYTGDEDSDWYAGTADAAYQNLSYIQRYRPQWVLILSGDHIYNMDYRPLIEFHRSHEAALTIACQEVPLKETSRFGIVVADANDRIVGFQEKPKDNPLSNLANLGIYVFDARILAERLRADARNADSGHDFGKNVIPGMVKPLPCYAYRFTGYWRDVGEVASYWEAQMDILNPRSELKLDRWQVYTSSKSMGEGCLAPARIRRRGAVEHSVVSWGCQIEGLVRRSILSPGVRVGPGSVVEDSVLLNNVLIGNDCMIRRAIVDKNCAISDRAVVGPAHANPMPPRVEGVEPVITLIGKNARVPNDYVVVPGTTVPIGAQPEDLSPSSIRSRQ